MTVSVGDSFVIAGVAVLCLAIFIGVVLWMNKRPHAKNPQQSTKQTGVAGGVHLGDPRSMSPHRDEVVEPPAEDTSVTGRPRDGRPR